MGNFAIFDALIKAGADASGADADKDGKTLLLAACEGGSLVICEALIKADADASVQDKGGRTPLLAACEGGNMAIFDAVIKAGADIHIARHDGATTLALSVKSANWKLVEYVLQRRSNVLDSSDPIVVASDLVQLASAYVQPVGIHAQLRDGASPLSLRGEMGALLSALETTRDIIGADHAATLKVQLGHVRAFVDHHSSILQNPPVSLAHTVTQLAAQEPDVVFGGGQATMPATETANQPAMIEWLNKPQTTRPCQWTLRAGESVNGVAYSSDGTKLARAVGSDVVVCDAVSGFEVCRLTGHRNTVTSVAFHPTKPNSLASGSRDNSIVIWDLTTGKRESTLSGHSEPVSSVAWSKDGTLASGSADNSVKIWVMDSSNKLKLQSTLSGHSDDVTSVAWSMDGTLASGSVDNSVKIWIMDSTGTFKCKSTLSGHSS